MFLQEQRGKKKEEPCTRDVAFACLKIQPHLDNAKAA